MEKLYILSDRKIKLIHNNNCAGICWDLLGNIAESLFLDVILPKEEKTLPNPTEEQLL